MNGHIKLHRALTEWGWYKDLPTCKLWLHVLLRANYKDCEWQGIEIPRGAFATSYAALSAESGLSVQQVRTALGSRNSERPVRRLLRHEQRYAYRL